MQTIAKSMGVVVQTVHGTLKETMPDPLPKPPGPRPRTHHHQGSIPTTGEAGN